MEKLTIILIVIFISQYSSIDATTYKVVPNNTGCLPNNSCVDFATLLHHVHIESNTTISFHPGTYEMQVKITFHLVLESLSNVTFTSSDSNQRARIKCSEEFKLIWVILNSSNIHFQMMELIKCSAPMNFSYAFKSPSIIEFIHSHNTLLSMTMLFAQAANVSLNNTSIDDSNKTVLFAYNIEENFDIVKCVFYGITHVLEKEGASIKFVVRMTEFFAGVKDLSQNGGILLDVSKFAANFSCVIIDSNFYGIEETYGFLLSVNYLDSLDIQLWNASFFQSGISIFYPASNPTFIQNMKVEISVYNCLFIFTTPGLEVSGVSNKKLESSVILTLSSSKVVGSGRGVWTSYATTHLVDNTFENNSAALRIKHSTVYFKGRNVFSNNIAIPQTFSAVLLTEKTQAFIGGELVISENYGKKYSAVVVKNSNLFISGSVHFSENTGFYGGALSLYSDSFLRMLPGGSITFIGNHAMKTGGALFIQTESCTQDLTVPCFYRFPRAVKTIWYFCNNTSVQGGDSIYGGSIDDCELNKPSWFNKNTVFCDQYSYSTSPISSNPKRLCCCNDTNVVCDQLEANIAVVPGQSFELSLTAVGQRFGSTIATVQAKFINYSPEPGFMVEPYIEHSQRRQLVERSCSSVRYTVHGKIRPLKQTLYLTITDLADEDIKTNLEYYALTSKHDVITEFSPEFPFSVNILLKECPLGYVFKQETHSCTCLQSLVEEGVQCNIQNATVKKSGNQWINATQETLIVHKHCPHTYCRKEQIEFLLSDPNMQCMFNRSGTLCGQCIKNLSQVIGSSNCQECSNSWLLLIIPLTLVSGVLLVVFTISLNLTVAAGTINGII